MHKNYAYGRSLANMISSKKHYTKGIYDRIGGARGGVQYFGRLTITRKP